MNAQPAPFTPADCDLRGYEWMPLFGARLFASNFEAHASDLAFRIAIKLYWECWQQVPAASLPNDDVQLCRLAGLGRDLKTWRKLRADGVLHGFVLCADDRLYHGLLADEALKAWEARRRQQVEREGSRDRMRKWRVNKTNGDARNVTRNINQSYASRYAAVTGNVTSRATDSTVQEMREERPTPLPPTPWGGGTPASPGTPPAGRRSNGSNPRAEGTNPRAAGRREGYVSGGIAVLADRLRQRAEAHRGDDLTDERSCFQALQIVDGGRG